MKKEKADILARTVGGAAGLVLLAVILVAANSILGNLRVRADLTEHKLYTLSEGTRNILGELDSNVTLKFFFNSSSPEVPSVLKNYARQVEDLLREYRIASGRRITIETFDPRPDSDAEEWAERYGLPSQQIGMLGPRLYLGLVAVAGDTEATIPVLDPRLESLLEYHITRLIYRVGHPEKPVIGIMSSLPVLGTRAPQYPIPGQPAPPSQPAWLAFQDLEEDYELRELPLSTEEIPGDVRALVVVHPKDLSPATQFAIDQFVLGGGHVLAFLDPASLAETEMAGPAPFGRGRKGSDLGNLLGVWGVRYRPAMVVADVNAASRVRGAQNRVESSPVWLSLRAANVSRDDLLTSQLESIMMPYAGAFADDTNEDLEFSPLITTSERVGVVGAMSAQFGTEAVRRDFKPESAPLHLAVRLSGKFTTAFPNGNPAGDEPERGAEKEDAKDEKDEDEKEEETSLKEGESLVILVGDSDMLFDRFCVQQIDFFGFAAHQPMNNNLDLLANAVEQVSGSSDMVSIRSRGEFNRPFDLVLRLEQEARREWQAKEDSLSEKLRETQRQLRQLQSEKDQSQRFILSARQRDAIKGFREEEHRIKQELKQVRKNLRSNIERLGATVKALNIALMPLVVSLVGVSYGLFRRRRR